jgi:hypothetical protein
VISIVVSTVSNEAIAGVYNIYVPQLVRLNDKCSSQWDRDLAVFLVLVSLTLL